MRRWAAVCAPSREAKRARRAVRQAGRQGQASCPARVSTDGRSRCGAAATDRARWPRMSCGASAFVAQAALGAACCAAICRGERYREAGTRCRLDGRWSKRHSRCVRNDRQNRAARAHRDVESWAQMLWIEMPQRPDARCGAVETVTRKRTAIRNATDSRSDTASHFRFARRGGQAKHDHRDAPKERALSVERNGARHPHRHPTG